MAKQRKTWVYKPPRPKKPAVSDGVKIELMRKAQQLIDDHLKPAHVKPPPKKPEFNYIIDLLAKWTLKQEACDPGGDLGYLASMITLCFILAVARRDPNDPRCPVGSCLTRGLENDVKCVNVAQL